VSASSNGRWTDRVVEHFQPAPQSVASVRSLIRRYLPTGSDPYGSAVLAASELATNVVCHARTRYLVALSRCGDRLRVEVSDASALLPAVADSIDAERPSGRGLPLVEALATSWGVDLSTNGKVIWFEIELGR